MFKTPSVLLVLAALPLTVGVARGGHELPVYPSYYPHEIAIEAMRPERAADLLRDATLHAYLGAEPRFPSAVPTSVRPVESLGGGHATQVHQRQRHVFQRGLARQQIELLKHKADLAVAHGRQ